MSSETTSLPPLALRLLNAQLKQGRLPSAYLFYGDGQCKKEEFAQAFARALVGAHREIAWYCPCPSCERVAKGNHPDVLWLKRQEDTKGIKIESVRRLLDWASLRPYESERKIAILEEAERLSEEAAQALLKTLEEPPPSTIFVLLTEDKAQVLETIQSRAFAIRLSAPASQETEGAGPANGPGSVAWEEYLEKAAAYKREPLLTFLDGLLQYFQQWLRKDPGEAELKAIDAVYEAKAAVEANANGKLTLTWLAIQLNRAFPMTGAVRPV